MRESCLSAKSKIIIFDQKELKIAAVSIPPDISLPFPTLPRVGLHSRLPPSYTTEYYSLGALLLNNTWFYYYKIPNIFQSWCIARDQSWILLALRQLMIRNIVTKCQSFMERLKDVVMALKRSFLPFPMSHSRCIAIPVKSTSFSGTFFIASSGNCSVF